MSDELKLKPCPFCRGEAFVHMLGNEIAKGYYIACDECGAKTIVFGYEAEAIEAWNRRVERTAKVEEVEKPNVFKCSECGQYFHSTAWGSPVEYCSRCGTRLEWK